MTSTSKAYPQSSIEEVIDSEREMIRDGESRYGRYYALARNSTLYLTLCVESIDADRTEIFGRLFSLIKKHQMLGFLSALRLHHVQTMMNLRQVLEAGSAASYAIANPKIEDFVDTDDFGIMDPSKELTSKRYKWLDANYPAPSSWIREQKSLINGQAAHASIITGNSVFRIVAEKKGVSTPFFDIEDEDFVKIDLWQISSVAVNLMQLFSTVTSEVARTAGRTVLGFRSDFQRTVSGLAAECNTLLDEAKCGERYIAAMAKAAQRAEVSKKG
jgi:hypothetical protein